LKEEKEEKECDEDHREGESEKQRLEGKGQL
jgi:hypothetical protein